MRASALGEQGNNGRSDFGVRGRSPFSVSKATKPPVWNGEPETFLMCQMEILSFMSLYGFEGFLQSAVDMEVQQYAIQGLVGLGYEEGDIQAVRRVRYLLVANVSISIIKHNM